LLFVWYQVRLGRHSYLPLRDTLKGIHRSCAAFVALNLCPPETSLNHLIAFTGRCDMSQCARRQACHEHCIKVCAATPGYDLLAPMSIRQEHMETSKKDCHIGRENKRRRSPSISRATAKHFRGIMDAVEAPDSNLQTDPLPSGTLPWRRKPSVVHCPPSRRDAIVRQTGSP
jgi:hypothetical protein